MARRTSLLLTSSRHFELRMPRSSFLHGQSFLVVSLCPSAWRRYQSLQPADRCIPEQGSDDYVQLQPRLSYWDLWTIQRNGWQLQETFGPNVREPLVLSGCPIL